MLETQRIPAEVGAQFVIAVFDEWEALQAVLEDMSLREFDRFGTLLYARNDDPPPVVLSRLLKEITKLQYEGSKHHICCTRGGVATELAARLAHGARSLADALRSWLSTDQARQLQSHIEKGHLVLWLRLPTSEEFGRVCGRLVQATPHMVGLCNIVKNT
jgi:hypothetical protein